MISDKDDMSSDDEFPDLPWDKKSHEDIPSDSNDDDDFARCLKGVQKLTNDLDSLLPTNNVYAQQKFSNCNNEDKTEFQKDNLFSDLNNHSDFEDIPKDGELDYLNKIINDFNLLNHNIIMPNEVFYEINIFDSNKFQCLFREEELNCYKNECKFCSNNKCLIFAVISSSGNVQNLQMKKELLLHLMYCVSVCKDVKPFYALQKFLSNQFVKNEIQYSDWRTHLYKILLNFGLNLELYCPSKDLLLEYENVKTQIKETGDFPQVPVKHWATCFNNILDIVSQLINMSKITDSEICELFLLILWICLDEAREKMKCDNNFSLRQSLCTLLKKFSSHFDIIEELSTAISQIDIKDTSDEIRLKFCYEAVKTLPQCTVKEQQLKRISAYKTVCVFFKVEVKIINNIIKFCDLQYIVEKFRDYLYESAVKNEENVPYIDSLLSLINLSFGFEKNIKAEDIPILNAVLSDCKIFLKNHNLKEHFQRLIMSIQFMNCTEISFLEELSYCRKNITAIKHSTEYAISSKENEEKNRNYQNTNNQILDLFNCSKASKREANCVLNETEAKKLKLTSIESENSLSVLSITTKPKNVGFESLEICNNNIAVCIDQQTETLNSLMRLSLEYNNIEDDAADEKDDVADEEDDADEKEDGDGFPWVCDEKINANIQNDNTYGSRNHNDGVFSNFKENNVMPHDHEVLKYTSMDNLKLISHNMDMDNVNEFASDVNLTHEEAIHDGKNLEVKQFPLKNLIKITSLSNNITPIELCPLISTIQNQQTLLSNYLFRNENFNPSEKNEQIHFQEDVENLNCVKTVSSSVPSSMSNNWTTEMICPLTVAMNKQLQIVENVQKDIQNERNFSASENLNPIVTSECSLISMTTIQRPQTIESTSQFMNVKESEQNTQTPIQADIQNEKHLNCVSIMPSPISYSMFCDKTLKISSPLISAVKNHPPQGVESEFQNVIITSNEDKQSLIQKDFQNKKDFPMVPLPHENTNSVKTVSSSTSNNRSSEMKCLPRFVRKHEHPQTVDFISPFKKANVITSEEDKQTHIQEDIQDKIDFHVMHVQHENTNNVKTVSLSTSENLTEALDFDSPFTNATIITSEEDKQTHIQEDNHHSFHKNPKNGNDAISSSISTSNNGMLEKLYSLISAAKNNQSQMVKSNSEISEENEQTHIQEDVQNERYLHTENSFHENLNCINTTSSFTSSSSDNETSGILYPLISTIKNKQTLELNSNFLNANISEEDKQTRIQNQINVHVEKSFHSNFTQSKSLSTSSSTASSTSDNSTSKTVCSIPTTHGQTVKSNSQFEKKMDAISDKDIHAQNGGSCTSSLVNNEKANIEKQNISPLLQKENADEFEIIFENINTNKPTSFLKTIFINKDGRVECPEQEEPFFADTLQRNSLCAFGNILRVNNSDSYRKNNVSKFVQDDRLLVPPTNMHTYRKRKIWVERRKNEAISPPPECVDISEDDNSNKDNSSQNSANFPDDVIPLILNSTKTFKPSHKKTRFDSENNAVRSSVMVFKTEELPHVNSRQSSSSVTSSFINHVSSINRHVMNLSATTSSTDVNHIWNRPTTIHQTNNYQNSTECQNLNSLPNSVLRQTVKNKENKQT